MTDTERINFIKKHIIGKCLDAGCGSGHRYSGVGLDREFVITNRLKKPIVKGDLEHLPFKQNIFDTIIISEVIEHLLKPYEAMLELRRCLKDNGQILLTTPSALSLHCALKNGYPKVHYFTFFPSQLKHFLSDCGFEIKEMKMIDIHKKNILFRIITTLIPITRNFICVIAVKKN